MAELQEYRDLLIELEAWLRQYPWKDSEELMFEAGEYSAAIKQLLGKDTEGE